jgi:shikimate kinase
MGTGKTTVGQLVADCIGWSFVDADDEIVERAGMTIPQIFEREGEAGFRTVERMICQSLAARTSIVIATGGGMLVDEGNRAVMLASGLVICLNAAPDTLAERLAGDEGRPLLKSDWRALLEKRREVYASIPLQVDTTGKAPHDVALEIVELWRSISL